MDLHVYGRVLWRFRVIVAFGLLLAITLAVLSIAKLSFDGVRLTFQYRQPETWQATTTLLVTQQGFPWGRSVLPIAQGSSPDGAAAGEGGPSGPSFADPSRFAYLAVFYAQLANGDAVQSLLRREAGLDGVMTAAALVDNNSKDVLPFVNIFGLADSPEEAARVSRRASAIFTAHIAAGQNRANIEREERVLLEPVTMPRGAELVEGRKLTTPVFILLAVMILTLGLVFVLENVRPRVRFVADPSGAPPSSVVRVREPA
jgi:hypothetical protein